MELEGAAQPITATLPPELQNLAESIDPETLKAIGQRVVEEYEEDERGRGDWLAMHAKWLELYFQKDKATNPPWPGSSQESIPMLAEACNQFHARAFQALFPNRSILKAIPTGNISDADMKRAERVAKHMSWQLLVKDKTYKRRKDALLLAVPLHGSVFTKTYYDPYLGRNVTENVRAEDFVVPYGYGPRELEDIERKTQILWRTVNQTKVLAARGFFIDFCEPFRKGEGKPTTAARDKAEGLNRTPTVDKTDCKILESHCVLDLDGDGIEEPYIVWVDAQTMKVKRIAIRYETDQLGAPANDKEPIEHYDHWMFQPNPDGFYGLGYGHLIGQINTAVNKLMRQTVDAGQLANLKSGFIDDTIGLQGGELEMSMGKFKKVRSGGTRIADHIMEFQFSGPEVSIMQAMETLMMRGDRLAAVTDAVTGQMEKVQQPTVVLSLVEQSLQGFSAVYERLLVTWESELRKHFRLNGRYMPEKEYVTVMDLPGLEHFQIGKMDYRDDLQVLPIADPKMATEQQKLARAQAEWEFLSMNPLVLQSPEHFYNASKRYLEAIQTQNINAVLPRPLTPGRVDDPALENMSALMPQPVIPGVFPDQDHLIHLQVHNSLFSDPAYGPLLTPQGAMAMQQHIQMHIAYLHGTTETRMGDLAGGQIGAPSMVPQPGVVLLPPGALGGAPAGGGLDGGGNNGAGGPPQGQGNGVQNNRGAPARG